MAIAPEHFIGFRRAFRFSLTLIVTITTCAAVVAGCGKEDTIVGPPGPPIPAYPTLSSPQNVLAALRKAYVSRDSVEYKLLFDPLYIGTYIDRRDPSSVLDTLTWADEAQHIAALARSTATVDLEFYSRLIRSTDAGDPPGWALIQNPISKLAIYDTPTVYEIPAGAETIEFRFVPKTPDSTSPTDTTWKIIRWLEVAN